MTTLNADAEAVYLPGGVPRRLDLLSQRNPDPSDTMQGWRNVITDMPSMHFNDEPKVLVITDTELTGPDMFNLTSNEDNPAARSWLPMKVVHRDCHGEFFHLANNTAWNRQVEDVLAHQAASGTSIIALCLGHRALIARPPQVTSHTRLLNEIMARLENLASRTRVTVVYSGIPILGSDTDKWTCRQVNRKLWLNANDLAVCGVRFLDCCTPAVDVRDGEIWRGQERGFKTQFKAVSLFVLGQLVKVTWDNLWTPLPLVMPTDYDKEQLIKFVKLRGQMPA